jgi:predicted ArsR family transcriptional regulator
MGDRDFDGFADIAALRAVAALSEDQRRRLYRFARAERRPVTREEAAAALGISRKLAAFHLDKLVEAGLLRAHFLARGRAGAGRRPKAYEPTDTSFELSVPARRHELLADILVQAVLTETHHGSARVAALESAHHRGREVGTDLRVRSRPGRLGAERALRAASTALESAGFEPSQAGPARVRLRNCPFHPLAREAPDLVCGLNHSFIRGLIDGLQAPTLDVVLEPAAGECCVELRAKSPGEPGRS